MPLWVLMLHCSLPEKGEPLLATWHAFQKYLPSEKCILSKCPDEAALLCSGGGGVACPISWM